MVQAVLEGVAFAIRDSFEVAKSLGVAIPRSKLCGGGAKSPLWRKIFTNVLGIPLDMVKTEQGPGYGAAMLAMVGCGKFHTVQEAADTLVETASTTEPDASLTAKYENRYQSFKMRRRRMLFPVAMRSITGYAFIPILLASFNVVILQNIRDGSRMQDDNALCNSNVKLEGDEV